MRRLDPNKLHVTFRNGVSTTEPLIPRRYTLTHSDLTAELFLTIGLDYVYEEFTSLRDEVIAEWRTHNGSLYLFVSVYVGDYGPNETAIRDEIFRRELPLALEAIIYGDRTFFLTHPGLDHVPIWIHFEAKEHKYRSFEFWGTPLDYK